MTQLQVKGLRKNFGGLAALANVSFTVEPGERRAIIGPNGAGKTTLFNLISGELSPTEGSVYLDGREISRLPVYERANLGLGHTFQRNNLFLGLSVLENVHLAVQHKHRIARNPIKRVAGFTHVIRETEDLLDQLGLSDQRDSLASALAYGQQRALEVALALATDPKILLLDEPTAGMSPAETKEMINLIESLPRSLTMLIVEHDMDVVFSLADCITVLHFGQVISEGAPLEVRADPQVQEIYLGA